MPEPTPPGPGQTLFRFVRYWSRRWTGAGEAVEVDRGRDVMVLEAVCSSKPSPASVRDVARQLGLDQSGASRLVAGAVSRGLLSSTASTQDARARQLLLTPEGARLIEDAHRWQEEVFEELTSGWSQRDVEQFHRLMSRLIGDTR